jgi:hypothetical protein
LPAAPTSARPVYGRFGGPPVPGLTLRRAIGKLPAHPVAAEKCAHPAVTSLTATDRWDDKASMTIVGVTGILLSFVSLLFASVRPSQGRLLFAILLILLHIAASVAYYAYAQSNPADAYLYYFDPVRMKTWDFAFGTVFMVQMVDALKSVVGGTYLDYFLLFQAFGAWGVILLLRTFQEIHDRLHERPSELSYALLLFPGLHFWTSALGKDAPMFLGVTLATWAALRLPARLVPFALGVGLMVLFRPHIAFVATVAIALTAFFDSRPNKLTKAALLAIATAGSAYVALTLKSTFNVDVTNANSVSDFFATQYKVSQTIGGGTSVHGASFPFRLISLLFRPLFIDANGFMGLVASLENLFFVFMFGFLLLNIKEAFFLARRVFFLRFAILFTIAMTILLASVFYNVGLGLRQKAMIYPAIFSFFVAQWAFHRANVRSRRRPQPGTVPAPSATLVASPAVAKGAE